MAWVCYILKKRWRCFGLGDAPIAQTCRRHSPARAGLELPSIRRDRDSISYLEWANRYVSWVSALRIFKSMNLHARYPTLLSPEQIRHIASRVSCLPFSCKKAIRYICRIPDP